MALQTRSIDRWPLPDHFPRGTETICEGELSTSVDESTNAYQAATSLRRHAHLSTLDTRARTLSDLSPPLKSSASNTWPMSVPWRFPAKKVFQKVRSRLGRHIEGIQCFHFIELGDPKPGRDAARAGLLDKFRVIY